MNHPPTNTETLRANSLFGRPLSFAQSPSNAHAAPGTGGLEGFEISAGDGTQRETLHHHAKGLPGECPFKAPSSTPTPHTRDLALSTGQPPRTLNYLEFIRKTIGDKENPFMESQIELLDELLTLAAELPDHIDFRSFAEDHLKHINAILLNAPKTPRPEGEESGPPQLMRHDTQASGVIDRVLQDFLNSSPRNESAHATAAHGHMYSFERHGLTLSDLGNYIAELETHIETKTQPKGSSPTDLLLMDDLVAFENKINPGINAHYVDDAWNFGERLHQLLARAAHEGAADFSARLVVNIGPVVFFLSDHQFYTKTNKVHFCAFDVRMIGNQLSIIAMEPADYSVGDAITWLKAKVSHSLRRHLPNAKAAFIALRTQCSTDECGIFSLSFIRKSFSEKSALDDLHRKNITGDLESADQAFLENQFPPAFMKHTHSFNRLQFYLGHQPRFQQTEINRKQQTLEERFQSHLVRPAAPFQEPVNSDSGPREYNNSIEQKRLSIIKAFFTEVESRQGPAMHALAGHPQPD